MQAVALAIICTVAYLVVVGWTIYRLKKAGF